MQASRQRGRKAECGGASGGHTPGSARRRCRERISRYGASRGVSSRRARRAAAGRERARRRGRGERQREHGPLLRLTPALTRGWDWRSRQVRNVAEAYLARHVSRLENAPLETRNWRNVRHFDRTGERLLRVQGSVPKMFFACLLPRVRPFFRVASRAASHPPPEGSSVRFRESRSMHASSVRALPRPPPARRSRAAWRSRARRQKSAVRHKIRVRGAQTTPVLGPRLRAPPDLSSPLRPSPALSTETGPAPRSLRSRRPGDARALQVRLRAPHPLSCRRHDHEAGPFPDSRDCRRTSRTDSRSSCRIGGATRRRASRLSSFFDSSARRTRSPLNPLSALTTAFPPTRATPVTSPEPRLSAARSTARRCARRRRAPRSRFEAAARR